MNPNSPSEHHNTVVSGSAIHSLHQLGFTETIHADYNHGETDFLAQSPHSC